MAQAASSVLRLGEATDQEPVARDWLGREGLDGIVAKRLDLPYQSGERAMRKFKLWRTVDCVVAGLYRKRGTQAVEHLLLGLYDEEGLLNYVGRARIYEDAAEIGRLLEPLVGGSGFTGRAPGGKSRWSGKERVPVPLSRSSSSRSALITSPASTCVTERGCCAGARTRRPRAARWIRSGDWLRRHMGTRKMGDDMSGEFARPAPGRCGASAARATSGSIRGASKPSAATRSTTPHPLLLSTADSVTAMPHATGRSALGGVGAQPQIASRAEVGTSPLFNAVELEGRFGVAP